MNHLQYMTSLLSGDLSNQYALLRERLSVESLDAELPSSIGYFQRRLLECFQSARQMAARPKKGEPKQFYLENFTDYADHFLHRELLEMKIGRTSLMFRLGTPQKTQVGRIPNQVVAEGKLVSRAGSAPVYQVTIPADYVGFQKGHTAAGTPVKAPDSLSAPCLVWSETARVA